MDRSVDCGGEDDVTTCGLLRAVGLQLLASVGYSSV
jgi:hypothetical protein